MRILRTTLGAIAALLVASQALADDPAPATIPPATTPPAAATSSPAAAGPAKTNPSGISEEARTHFAAGVSLLQDPEGEKVEEAYREFQKAYEISASPKILGNLGFCAMRLERDGEAIEAYSRYLRDVPDIDADERAQIVRDLQTLTVGVARLTIQTDKPGVRILDVRTPTRGERITNIYGPVDGKIDIGVRPGHHVITAKLADHEDATWEVDAFAASRDRYAFTMRPRVLPVSGPPPGAEGRGTNVGPWIVMGIGGAMLVGGAITGIVALDKTNTIESKCSNDVCPRSFDLDGERSSARTFVRVTDVLLIGGSVVTLGGLGWFLFGGNKHESGPAKPAARGAPAVRASLPVPTAGCGPDGCRASVKVVF
jgi:hypothetical protein